MTLSPVRPSGGARSVARLHAVQALFQCHHSGDKGAKVVVEFLGHRQSQEVDGEPLAAPDPEFFKDIVAGVEARLAEIDPMIEAHLAANWKLARIDPLVLQILRAAVYELLGRPDIPTAVVIDEYVNVAHAFYEGAEPKFVNALLDKLAKGLDR